MNRKSIELLLAAAAAASTNAASASPQLSFDELPNQSLDAPYHGQHVGVALTDLNGDGATDLLFAAGRHWVDQPYALINLGPEHDGDGEFVGVKFSEALPVGPPGAYYQVDVSLSSRSDDSTRRSTVLLVGGTCHVEKANSLGSCRKGENTPARVVEVSMSTEAGCSIHEPDAECDLKYENLWEHPNPRGDRNGGFATFDDKKMIALLGQGGIELFHAHVSNTPDHPNLMHTTYSSVFHYSPPPKTDPRSDYARYAGFAAGSLPALGGVIAAGRRSDFDAPQRDEDGNIIGINKLVSEDGAGSFRALTLPSTVTGEPYPGDERYSVQTTNYAFADIDGDGVQDLLEATFLYESQRKLGYPLPQRVHFLNEAGQVKETLVILEDGDEGTLQEEDAGRSVTTGQIFSDSPLPDVVFASAEGVVTLFANLGVDEESGEFLGMEQRHRLSVGTECSVRDVAVAKLVQDQAEEKCWIGIVCALMCGEPDVLGKNHIFYVEGDGAVCSGGDDDPAILMEGGLLQKSMV
mmetsp:Transcript_48068/g.102250  ORF Transcript_48068/g.102250 Transcript_48068/m.102250 type:complete len:522 (-) Transcript_48068:115-1680(-)